MGRAILRGGKIAVVTIAVIAAVVGCALYWSGVFTSAEIVEVVQEPVGVGSADEGQRAGAAELAAFERVVDEYTGAGRESDLEALCENAIRYAPGSEQDLVARQALTGLYIRKREADSAAGAIEEMVALFGEHPRIARALCETGDAYRKMRQFAEAEQCYRNVVEQFGDNPYSIWSQKDLCTLYVQTGDAGARDAALDELVGRYAEHPELPLAICGVGDEAAAVRKDYENARGLYQYVAANFASNPQAIWAQKNLCRLLVERVGDVDAAQVETDRLMRDFAENASLPAAVLEVADAWRNKDYIVEARGLYERIVADYPESEQAVWSQKNICTICAGKQDIAGLDGALGRLTVEFGERKGAPAAMCGIGDACAEAGLFDKAEEIYKHVVGAYAGDESVLWARKDLCLLRMRMGDAAGADGAISQLAGDFAGDARLSQHLCELADGWRRYNEEARARTLYQHVIETWPGQTWAMWSAKNLIAMEIEESEDPDGPLESIPPPILETVDAMISGYKEQAELPHAVFLIGEEYYGLGEKARKVGARQWEANFSKSVIVWGKVIEELATGPYTLMARDYRGGACRAIGDYSAALDDYEWLAEGCPDYERHWHACFMVIRCYEDMAATRLLTNKEAAAGIIPAVERLIKGYPEWSERLKADRMIKRWEFMASLGEGVQ